MLKSLLTLLLSKFVKKSDTEFIAQQAMPEGWVRRVLLKDSVLGKIQDVYTAPSNGYLCIDGGNAIRYIAISGSNTRYQRLLCSISRNSFLTAPPLNRGAFV